MEAMGLNFFDNKRKGEKMVGVLFCLEIRNVVNWLSHGHELEKFLITLLIGDLIKTDVKERTPSFLF